MAVSKERRSRKQEAIDSLVEERRTGDGADPREEQRVLRARARAGKPDYSIFKLAKEIQETLVLVLAQHEDPRLASLAVGNVEPSASGAIFVVQVFSTDPASDYSPRQVKELLDRLKPRLRAEVAREVIRKHAPDFKFDVLPPGVFPR